MVFLVFLIFLVLCFFGFVFFGFGFLFGAFVFLILGSGISLSTKHVTQSCGVVPAKVFGC